MKPRGGYNAPEVVKAWSGGTGSGFVRKTQQGVFTIRKSGGRQSSYVLRLDGCEIERQQRYVDCMHTVEKRLGTA